MTAATKTTAGPLRRIPLDRLDRNLVADLEVRTAGWRAYTAPYPGATVANQAYHVVFSAERGRGGVVQVGSGSSGATHWTDAASAGDTLRRYLDDDMRP